jgi:hypothetical protein
MHQLQSLFLTNLNLHEPGMSIKLGCVKIFDAPGHNVTRIVIVEAHPAIRSGHFL